MDHYLTTYRKDYLWPNLPGQGYYGGSGPGGAGPSRGGPGGGGADYRQGPPPPPHRDPRRNEPRYARRNSTSNQTPYPGGMYAPNQPMANQNQYPRGMYPYNEPPGQGYMTNQTQYPSGMPPNGAEYQRSTRRREDPSYGRRWSMASNAPRSRQARGGPPTSGQPTGLEILQI